MRRVALFLIAPLLPVLLAAQSLSQRVATLGDGAIRLSFAARPGVCANGGHGFSVSDADDEWVADCEHGPVRVSMQVRGGIVTDAHTYVGGRWKQAAGTDLGTVPSAATAGDLLALAERSPAAGDELITAATLADSVTVWPRLLDIARKTSVPMDTRQRAIFWLGQAAGAAATGGLDSIAADGRGDIEIRKQAVFALSQRPVEEGVPVLIRIARSNPYKEVRKSALFWLGQSEDPRALALFEEILR